MLKAELTQLANGLVAGGKEKNRNEITAKSYGTYPKQPTTVSGGILSSV